MVGFILCHVKDCQYRSLSKCLLHYPHFSVGELCQLEMESYSVKLTCVTEPVMSCQFSHKKFVHEEGCTVCHSNRRLFATMCIDKDKTAAKQYLLSVHIYWHLGLKYFEYLLNKI